MASDKRNPLIIPKPTPSANGCPVCGAIDYRGRTVMGMLTRNCNKCGNEWYGGGYTERPVPNDRPVPPEPTPIVRFEKSTAKENAGQVVEIISPPSTVQEFRKGAPIPTSPQDEEI